MTDCIVKFLKVMVLCTTVLLPGEIHAQALSSNPGPVKHIYKTRGLTRLKLYVYQPLSRELDKRIPAIIFFHGGGLKERHTWEFEPQGKYLVERGMVAVLATYSIKHSGRTEFESIADVRSAIRWVRRHALELGIDENRIAAGGGSAGGYLAACAALIKDPGEKNADLSISPIPNALVLFNPRVIMPSTGDPPLSKKDIRYLNGRTLEELSPFHNISRGAPPTILFQGTADGEASVNDARQFCEKMVSFGNACEVVYYEGRVHGFFHYFHGNNPDFLSTMETTVLFLSKLGFIPGDQ